MIKRVCDRCGSENQVKTYKLPLQGTKIATGGMGNAKLFQLKTMGVEEIDLCLNCTTLLSVVMNWFLNEGKSIEENEKWS